RHHSEMCVYCSSGVRPVGCNLGPQPTMPTTSMSGSFQCPGPANLAHLSSPNPLLLIDCQLSRMSPVVRQALASRAQSAAPENGALFDRLRTMSRWLLRIAFAISSTCGGSIGFQSYLR